MKLQQNGIHDSSLVGRSVGGTEIYYFIAGEQIILMDESFIKKNCILNLNDTLAY